MVSWDACCKTQGKHRETGGSKAIQYQSILAFLPGGILGGRREAGITR